MPPDDRRRFSDPAGRPGALLLSHAVLAGRALGCSLSYLTRTTRERGRPPEECLRFDQAAYERRHKKAGLGAERVRELLRLSPRDGRRLALGTYEPTIGQVTSLEQVLRLPPGELATVSATGGR